MQFRVGYYLFAIPFLMFEVETVFLFPWAVIACYELGPGLFSILFSLFIGSGALHMPGGKERWNGSNEETQNKIHPLRSLQTTKRWRNWFGNNGGANGWIGVLRFHRLGQQFAVAARLQPVVAVSNYGLGEPATI